MLRRPCLIAALILIQCIVDTIEICVTSISSTFNHQHLLQTEGTTQGSHMTCSYADITMAKYDYLVSRFHIRPSIWKRFKNDEFALLKHGIVSASLSKFYGWNIKIKSTINFATDTDLEILNLKLESKIREDTFAKVTNSFSYTTPNTCYSEKSKCNVSKDLLGLNESVLVINRLMKPF